MNRDAKQFALLTSPGFCNAIVVLDPTQFVVGSIAVPGPTQSIVVSPDGKRAYVTHFDFFQRPEGLLVIDLASEKVIAEVPLEPGGFHDVAITPDTPMSLAARSSRSSTRPPTLWKPRCQWMLGFPLG
jgi:DNA-binding beta-propeller fold protein YncE